MKRAIVVGASAGIGRELAKILSGEGYLVGLASRRIGLLHALQRELPGASCVARLDVRRPEETREAFDALIREMGGVDLVVISAGVLFQDPSPEQEAETIAVNIAGFTALFRHAYDLFRARGGGQIVGISSVAAIRGGHGSPVYNASKAFVSSLMHGYRIRARRDGVRVLITDIRPGHVSTGMLEGQRGAFWVVSVDAAARRIAAAIRKGRRHAYVSPRWRLVAWAMRLLPDRLYCRFES
ncbi:MAG: SDR family NAD(P)-dependent oxidoreductase [Chlamydiae bacterium]|nr:SDR family NAD(P)-dependent oxidoreductase [Chlamydiota bacterium]